MTKRIAIIIRNADFIFADNVGSKYGGAAVVAQNVYQTFLNDFGFTVHVYARSFSQEYTNNCLFKISTSTEALLTDIDSKNYDLVLTLSVDGVYKNQVLQVMSKFWSIERSNFLIRPLLKLIYKNKLKYQSCVFSNLPEFATFIAVSEQVKSDYVKNLNIPEAKIKVIYPGCKIEPLRQPVKKAFELMNLGVVANSSINKGGHFFLLAAGIAKILGAKFRISMIAPKFRKDILLQVLVKLFGLNSLCTVYPKLEDMTEFYSDIDCIVLPSRSEAFGLVVLEGMSKGKVPIVSNTAGVAEIINDGCGIVFDSSSIFSLIKSIINLSRVYRFEFGKFENLSSSAYEVAQKYSWRSFCEKLLDM